MIVDIHNHILPGIDDGAGNLAEAAQMARQAVADGTEVMVATPHQAWILRRHADPVWLRRNVEDLQAELDRLRINLRVLPGVEIKIGPHVARGLAYGELMSLGDAGLSALIELPFNRIPADALDNLKSVIDAGYSVVLAHPERYTEVQNHLGFIEACADLGVTFQVTSGSLIGDFGPRALATAETIVRRAKGGWKIVIASDSHDASERHPGLMSVARDAAAALVGDDLARDMVDVLPRSLIGLA